MSFYVLWVNWPFRINEIVFYQYLATQKMANFLETLGDKQKIRCELVPWDTWTHISHKGNRRKEGKMRILWLVNDAFIHPWGWQRKEQKNER